MTQIQNFNNNASTNLSSGITNSQTSITVVDGSIFSTPTSVTFEILTISEGSNIEIVKLTARSGNTLTITRAQEGTTGLSFTSAAKVEARITKGTLSRFAQNLSTGTSAIALGAESVAAQNFSVALGYFAVANSGGGSNNIAIGPFSSVLGTKTNGIAIGNGATCRIDNSIVNSGTPLIRKAEAIGNPMLNYSGSQSIIFSEIIDLKTLLDDAVSIAIPSGATFFPDEVGVVITSASGVTGQPNVSFGITGNTVAILASTTTVGDAVKERDVFTPISKNGVNSLTASVKVAATGTTLSGRFYWKGIFVED